MHGTREARLIVLSVCSGGVAILAALTASALLGYAAIGPSAPATNRLFPESLQAVVLACAVALIGVLAVPAAYYGIQQARGKDVAPAQARPLKTWQALALALAWIAAAWVAQTLVQIEPWKWIAPAFYLCAIGIPVYVLLRLAAGGVQAGSRGRLWGLLAVSMSVSTGLAALVEFIVVLAAIAVAVIYLAMDPVRFEAVRRLVAQIANAAGVDQTLTIVGPWLERPQALVLGLVFFAGFSPVIEEITKSVAVWTVYDRLRSPAEGFVAGALSGAGFGLVESLLASATPDSTWAFTLLVRGGSTLMHIAAAALAGWGIGWFRASGRGMRLLGGYALAMALHGVWNAFVVAAAFGSLRASLHPGAADPAGLLLMVIGGSSLAAMCVSIPLALALINSRLRPAPAPSEG